MINLITKLCIALALPSESEQNAPSHRDGVKENILDFISDSYSELLQYPRLHMFRYKNRAEAGKILASELSSYRNMRDIVVLALPRGGVPVAAEIAYYLNLPLNIFLVRKLGVPNHEEVAMGAIAEGNICILNNDLIEQLKINNEQIQKVIYQEKQELARRLQLYRQNKKLPSLQQKTIILVDDGIATGASIKAAITALRLLQPKEIILAAPVASKESIFALSSLVNLIICPLLPDNFYGVGQWYEDFTQTTDEEVTHLLAK